MLRLSRESIRKEISIFKSKIPTINSNKDQKALAYLGISSQSWSDEETIQKSKLSEKLSKIKERRNFLAKEKEATKTTLSEYDKNILKQDRAERERNKRLIIDLINSSRDCANQYRYHDAILELRKAQEVDFENEFEIEILILLAKNYERLDDFNIALGLYENALKLAKETKDSRVCEIEFLIAMVDKNLFKIDDAKEKFKSIISNETNPHSYITKASIELGELEEADSNIQEAIECYNHALNLSLGKDKAHVCKCYYKLAVLYDEHQDYESALMYYQKNYTTSSERSENKYYSVSLTNIALIYSEQGKFKDAAEHFKLALLFDSEVNDWENMYFSQKELAKLYSRFDEVSSIGYYKQALDSAKKLNDIFKEALVHFEMGEFFYDRGEDEKALVNFFNAKLILKKVSDKENITRVESRIKDIKMRVDNAVFDLISQKYENQN